MMENQRIERFKQQALPISWRELLQYLHYAEHRTRRGVVVLEIMAAIACMAAFLVAPVSAGYEKPLLLGYLLCLAATISISAIGSNTCLRMAGRVVFVLLLAKTLAYLISLSPNQLMWSLTLCSLILVSMSPLYNEPLSFLLCAASVCHELALRHIGVLLQAPEADWMGVLIISSLSLGVLLNLFYFSERSRAYLSSCRLMEMAYIDSLTRIHNRRAFLDDLERACHGSTASGGFYFLLIDVDDFKAINDHHGHAKGDMVLQQVACQIRRLAGEHACGRLGGEEFGIIFYGDEAQALAFAERINRSIASSNVDGLRVTASIGLARHHSRSTLKSVMLQADKALYRAKAAGKDCAVLAPAQENLQ